MGAGENFNFHKNMVRRQKFKEELKGCEKY